MWVDSFGAINIHYRVYTTCKHMVLGLGFFLAFLAITVCTPFEFHHSVAQGGQCTRYSTIYALVNHMSRVGI